jgi:hypothetical protein
MAYKIKNIVLDDNDFNIINQLVKERGYGHRGFSIALRQIVREWQVFSMSVGIGMMPRPKDGAEVKVKTEIKDGGNGNM